MKTCPNCHAQLDDSSIFCTSCGTQFGAVPPQQNAVPPQQSAVPPQQNAIPPQQNAVPPQPAFAPAYDPYDHTAEFDPKDISDNKVFAMICYLMGFIGIIVALLATNSSKYAMFHVRQALKIEVASILSIFVLIIPFLGWIAFPILQGIIWVIKIISFFQICSGKAKEPAIIRSFGFFKITVHILWITQLRALKNTRSFFCKPQINILEIRTD